MTQLIPTGRLEQQGRMDEPESRSLMAALGDKKERRALFVGGCVRNALLRQPVEDIDVATIHTPEEVVERLEKAGFKTIPTGIEHGTITAVKNGHAFEVTTLRRDVATDGRRAVVAYTDDWREDAQRRDFTINTLLADEKGNVFDPLGQGLEDLKAGRVVFVGDPAQRIAEDYLRILRFFRFHARYGKGEPDTAALNACKAAADKIASLSKERITQELFKILMTEKPAQALSLMQAHGIMTQAAFDAQALETLCNLQHKYGLEKLAARLVLIGGIGETLLIPKVLRKEMQAIEAVLALPPLQDEQAVKVALYKHGRAATAQAFLLSSVPKRKETLSLIQNRDIPYFPVTGEDLIAQGHKPGPALGRALARLEEEWIGQGFPEDMK